MPMNTPGRILLWFAAGVGILLLAVGLLAWFALQTQPGHAFLLRTAVGQSDRFIDGEVRVGAIRSDGLLRGFILHDVSILDDRGRPFAEVDSLRVGYSARALLRRNIELVPTELWGPRIVIETLHGDEVGNLARIFRIPAAEPEPEDPELLEPDPSDEEVVAPASQLRVVLDGLGVHGGDLIIRTPLEGDPPARGIVETVPGFDGLHQVIRFSGIDARLGNARLVDLDEPGEFIEFESLSMTGQVFEEPFHVGDFQGHLRRTGTELLIGAERLELPASTLRGQIALEFGGDELELDLLLTADPLELADFRWLEPRIPDGGGRLTLSAAGPVTSGSWRVTDADLRSGESRIRGRLGLELAGGLRFVETDLVADPVYLSIAEPWLEEPLPLGGRVQGPVRLTGSFEELGIDARLEYEDTEAGIPPSMIEARGTLLLDGGEPGVRGMSARIDPLDFGTLSAFLPEFTVLGTGSLSVEASGRLANGLQLSADLRHRAPGGEESRVLGAGTIQLVNEQLRLSLDGGLDPMNLTGLAAALDLDLPIEGPVSGQYRVNGFLSDLELSTRLNTGGGTLTIDARGDATDLGRGYTFTASSSELDLTAFLTDLPEPTVIRGRVEVEGRGLDLETIEGTARVHLEDSRSGHVLFDLAELDIEALDGELQLHRLFVSSPAGEAAGSGTLGLSDAASAGEMSFTWSVPELSELRPLLMGDTIIQADTLSALELETLRWDGIDPDTLAAMNGRLLDGTASGELELRGALRAFELRGFADVERFRWSEAMVEGGRIDVIAQLDEFELTSIEGVAELADWGWREWTFEQGVAEARWAGGEGEVDLDLLREPGESYRADALFRQDSTGVDIELRSLVLEMDPVEWSLARPARLHVGDRRYEVVDLEIRRPEGAAAPDDPEDAPVRIRADGVVDLDGMTDFTLETERLDLNRLGHLARIENPPSGLLDLVLRVEGPAGAPLMEGEILAQDLNVGGTELDRVEGTFAYGEQIARARLDVEHEGQRLLTADGRYPVDLSFREVEDRFPDRSVDVTLEIDALPAATLLGFVEGLEEIEGVFDGRIQLSGQPRDLRPSGSLHLAGGAMSLPEIGLRPREIEADFELTTDGVVTVSAQARSRGLAQVRGTIDLNDITDPGFDLRITASGFQATERRDLEARVGGEVTLTGRFQAPRIGGRVRVEQGVMFLEEFARTAEVVDLTDPAIFDVVDTTLVADRPAVEAAQNPFLNNLVVNVDLTIQRDFWLRSREMNVEIGGDLIVTFDRPKREILLVGSLEAIRGNYNVLGRQFQVQEGNVEFVGTPGINPTLDFRAVHRLRREGQEPLNIIAVVEGPLLALRIGLESEAQPPIAESDLISYLLFGRPSFALGSGEASALQGAAGAGVSVGIGTLAGQLSSVVAQQIGIDYFAITQTRDAGGAAMGGFGSAFADTQIEVGQYLAQDLFLAMVLRPLGGMGGGQAQIPGARLEWRFTDTWTFEAFVEDRFGREGVYSFGDAGLQLTRIFGLELYREWGY
ncbi:MAG: translocation/assembly module TamB [Gemmatimonadales bacterium]|nr:MAG: translocation/assembly module TamB [Gemmatimonadales bacterium]